MKTLLIGLVVGGLGGLAVQKYVLGADRADAVRRHRDSKTEERVVVDRRVKEVPASAADRVVAGATMSTIDDRVDLSIDFGGVKVPETDEEIDLLLEEWTQTDDLDKFLALVRALLLQGERGYPKLTKVLLRFTGKMMMRKYPVEDLAAKAVNAAKLAMRHEKELVGYVAYLMTDENVPPILKTSAMAAAMFLSMNRVKQADSFAPMLLKTFLESDGKLGKEQARMLIMAMGQLKQKSSVQPLLRMLDDPQQKRVHGRIIESLGKIGDQRAVGPLIKRLRRAGQNSWSQPELTALARIGSAEATAAAEQFIAGVENDDRFFHQAGSYLGVAKSDKVITLIRDRYRANTNSGNMWYVMRGLQQTGTPGSVALLEEMSRTATQPWVKSQAQRYLEERKKAKESLGASER